MARKSIERLYHEFSFVEGNQHIASEYAIQKLQELVSHFHLKNILELGLGIGSISKILLSLNKDILYTGTESNEFCLMALQQNLKEEYKRVQIFKDLKAVNKKNKFDLLIVDGKDQDLEVAKELITANGIIAIEGDRQTQQELLQKLFPRSMYVHSISAAKNKKCSPFSSNHWQGGIKIIFTNPTPKQYVWWLNEKIQTKIKYLSRRSIKDLI